MIDYVKLFQKELTAPGNFPDCYAFSMHKAGSSLMNKMIQQVCHRAKIPAINIPGKLFEHGISDGDWETDTRILSLVGPGRIYHGFRYLPSILLNDALWIRKRKSVLLIRDPRDALVSQYYSFGGRHFSHNLPDKNQEVFLAAAKNTAHMDIDEYVMSSAPAHHKRLTMYKENLDFSNVLLFRYEQIFFDKRKFLGDIFGYFNIPVESVLLDEIAKKNDVRPEVEDITKHIRKGTPNDHVTKLKTGTIARLNEIFRETCAWYGYDLA